MGEHRFRKLPVIVPGKGEVFMADPRLIVIEPDYNVRDMNSAETIAHVDWLADEIESQGYNPEMPLSVKRRGDDMIVVRGHCRLVACLKLIAKGFELVHIPVMQIGAGTSDIDLIFDQESSNNGLRLDPLARARLVLKARRAGVEDDEIARRMHWKSVASVKQHLDMLELPEPVKEHVRAGDISPTLARNIAKGVDPQFAADLIKANAEENERIKGKRRVTKKTLERDTKPKPKAEAKAPQPQPAPPAEPPPQPPAQPEQQGEAIEPPPVEEPADEYLDGIQNRPAHFSPLADEAPPAPEPVREPVTETAAPTGHGQLNGFFAVCEPFAVALEGWNLEEIGDEGTVLLEVKVPDAKRFSAAWNKATGVSQ